MKNTFLKPITAFSFASLTLFGCASSSDQARYSASQDYNRTEASAVGGYATETNQNELKALVVEKQVVLPLGPLSVTTLPLTNSMEVSEMFKDMGDTRSHDVLTLAKCSPNLSTFVQLFERSNLTAGLQHIDQVTIFAPTNEAFAQIPREQLEAMLRTENQEMLTNLIQAHVLPEDVAVSRLMGNTRITLSDDQYIPIVQDNVGSRVTVGGAQVVRNDIRASNGRIHVVDRVLMPTTNVPGLNGR